MALATVVAAPALLVLAWARPGPAVARELPALWLEPREIAAQRARDERDAARTPRSEAAERRLLRYREVMVAEHEGTESPGRARARHRALHDALHELGDDAIAAVRASDLRRAERALTDDTVAAGDRVAEIGAFTRILEGYGAIRDGRQRAPRFVIRTLFKARWNALHGRPPTDGLRPIELRAYWGWLALEAENAPLERRLDALERYREAGGERTAEALGILLLEHDRRAEAREALIAADARSPSFRLRNEALATSD